MKVFSMIPELIKSIIAGKSGPLDREVLEISESMQALEVTLFNELNDCLLAFKNIQDHDDPALMRLTSELQCALDIVKSATTNEERDRIYEILSSLGKSPE